LLARSAGSVAAYLSHALVSTALVYPQLVISATIPSHAAETSGLGLFGNVT